MLSICMHALGGCAARAPPCRDAGHRSVLQTGILQRLAQNGPFGRSVALCRAFIVACDAGNACSGVLDARRRTLVMFELVGPSVRRRPDERGTIECATDARVPMRMAEDSVFNAKFC